MESLRAYKKGLMQQLFPRDGETTPRLRFPEFCRQGEWEEQRDLVRAVKSAVAITPTGGEKVYKMRTSRICSQNIEDGVTAKTERY